MKKTITTIALAIVMTFGTTIANAGLLVSDRPAPSPNCSTSETAGIIIFNRIVYVVMGLLVSDNVSEPCSENVGTGLLVSD